MSTKPLFSLIFCFIARVRLAAAACYYADGVSVAPGAVPCDPSTGTTACCDENDFCLDNGLCLHLGVMTRGACTDGAWGSPCNKVCPDTVPDLGWGLYNCGGRWSCSRGDCSNTFSIVGGQQIVLRTDQLEGLGLTDAITLGAADTVPATACTATVTPSFRFSTVISSASSTASTSPDNGESSNVGAIAGGSIGGVVGIVILIGTITLFWRRRKRKGALRQRNSHEPAPEGVGFIGGYRKSEVDAQEQKYPTRLDSRAVYEMDTVRFPSELIDSGRARAELPH